MLLSQQLLLEASYDDFVVHPQYYRAVPRPTYEENSALDMKLIQKGQLEPIKVNRKMWILDGYTRHELLGQRGKKIKYLFMDFDTPEEELEYVVETNVMRRQLNKFQRIETVYGLYKQRREEMRSKNYDGMISTLESIKKGNNNSIGIGKDIGYQRQSVNKIIRELRDGYYVRIEKEFKKYEAGKGRGGTTINIVTMLPKGEAFLSNRSRKIRGGAGILVGKIIGLNRNTIAKGITIIDKADEEMKERLRSGAMSMNKAFNILTEIIPPPKEHKESTNPYYIDKYWRLKDIIQCPHCEHESPKSEYKRTVRFSRKKP